MKNVALKGDNLDGVCPQPPPIGFVLFTGNIGTGSPNVYINGKQAARVGDVTDEHCPADMLVHGKIIIGSSKVFINGMPAAYALETIQPHSGTASLTGGGSTNVFIE